MKNQDKIFSLIGQYFGIDIKECAYCSTDGCIDDRECVWAPCKSLQILIDEIYKLCKENENGN